jgi:hypothetical protein
VSSWFDEIIVRADHFMHLREIASELSNRLIRIWLRDESGEGPFARESGDLLGIDGDQTFYLFHEYFHGDNGADSTRAIKPVGRTWWQN